LFGLNIEVLAAPRAVDTRTHKDARMLNHVHQLRHDPRAAVAMLLAMVADSAGELSWFAGLGAWLLDALVVVVLWLLLAHRLVGAARWLLMVALLLEMIPGVGLFPSWTLAVPAVLACRRALSPDTAAAERAATAARVAPHDQCLASINGLAGGAKDGSGGGAGSGPSA
jgi:hypothetical protein